MTHCIAVYVSCAFFELLAGCGDSTNWVTLGKSNCAAAKVDQINAIKNLSDDAVMGRVAGKQLCGMSGLSSAGKFRCHGDEIQVGCKQG